MNEDELLSIAREAAKNCYAEYSGFKVGAALLCADGSVETGVNIENCSYGLSMCAERVAIFKAVSSGKNSFTKIAIAGGDEEVAFPCGACRQVMAEFCNSDLVVLCSTLDGKKVQRFSLDELLPHRFNK